LIHRAYWLARIANIAPFGNAAMVDTDYRQAPHLGACSASRAHRLRPEQFDNGIQSGAINPNMQREI
jgi:hypothetical protein